MDRNHTYDPRIVFDDLFGDEPGYGDVDYVGAAGLMVANAHSRRLRLSPSRIEHAPVDTTTWTFTPDGVVVGAGETGLPLFDHIKQRFASTTPTPKLVRVDDAASYRAFKETRRSPYMTQLSERLETADDVEVLGAVERALHGGDKIPMPFRDAFCWRDGAEILCTLSRGGKFLTAGVPADRYVEEAVVAGLGAGLEPEDIVVVGPAVAEILGASHVLEELCGVADELLRTDKRVVSLRSGTDPEMAAAMTLLQRCQRGDRQARVEAASLCRADRELCENAYDRLLRAQKEKAGGLS